MVISGADVPQHLWEALYKEGQNWGREVTLSAKRPAGKRLIQIQDLPVPIPFALFLRLDPLMPIVTFAPFKSTFGSQDGAITVFLFMGVHTPAGDGLVVSCPKWQDVAPVGGPDVVVTAWASPNFGAPVSWQEGPGPP